MSILSSLFGNKAANKSLLSRDKIINMLQTSPEKLAEFEAYYQTQVLPNLEPDIDNMFNVNAKQATAMSKQENLLSSDDIDKMVNNIVNELLTKTDTWCYDRCDPESNNNIRHLDVTNTTQVTLEEINSLPKELQPQLTGSLMCADIPHESGPSLLFMLKKMQETKNPNTKRDLYHHFRQGLDILDLDPITYEMIGTNQNSMGHWLPQLITANTDKNFFQIPSTTIVKVPLTLLQLTRNEFGSLTPTTKAIVNQWAIKAFGLNPEQDYFVKTGTYSSKFDFRNCRVCDPKEVLEIGEYLLYIHFSALQMASPLCTPCIYGVSTTNEWVVREYIPDKENNPVIYKGLPLHTEYRVFIDCDTNEILGVQPYWEPETMKKRFDEHRDGHDEHDAIVYRAYENTLMARYYENVDTVLFRTKELLQDLHLSGQWSLDIMQNGDEFWLIDMALAENSAGYDKVVDPALRHPRTENWLPVIK